MKKLCILSVVMIGFTIIKKIVEIKKKGSECQRYKGSIERKADFMSNDWT